MGFFQDMFDLILHEASSLWVQVFQELGRTVFFVEEALGIGTITEELAKLFTFLQIFAISLVILKVLKKGFYTYILWRDGDPDVPIQQTLINVALAVGTAVSFSTLYELYASVSLWLIEKISFSTFEMMGIEEWSQTISVFTDMFALFNLILLIYIIMLFVLYLQFLKRSAELLVLRLGFPLACLGLLDSDNGVFSSTVKVFIQTSLTTVAQLFFMMLSMSIFVNSTVNSTLINPFLCIACCSAAFATPKTLQFILLQTGGGGVGSKISTASQGVNLIRSVIGK